MRLISPIIYLFGFTFLISLSVIQISFAQVSLPDGFNIEWVSQDWIQAVGITFDETGTMYVWEKEGKVWIVKDGEKLPTPLLDISNEVGNYGDMGLLGFALDPNFSENGYIYCYYSVDNYHFFNENEPDFDPSQNQYFTATSGRLSRFQASANSNYEIADISSRKILIGKDLDDVIPILHNAHIGGSIIFGTDGTLLLSTGDGSTWKDTYTGNGPPYGEEYVTEGLELGIIDEVQEVGAFRAQLIDNPNGKILRIDPETGAGLPSNPFYDEAIPTSSKSRIWALGFRNAYRMILRPNSGSENPADGIPGSLYIGDVGEAKWEELNIANRPGMNFGWPHFEGIDFIPEYNDQLTLNLSAPNPMYGIDGCDQAFYNFQDLIRQKTELPSVFENPCGTETYIDSKHTFTHSLPALSLAHITVGNGIYVPVFDDNGNTVSLDIDDPASTVYGQGSGVRSNASMAVGFYEGETFPEEYHGKYFHTDFARGWIKVIEVDLNDNVLGIMPFYSDTFRISDASFNPVDGSLYFIDYENGIKRISYGENVPPVVIANSDIQYGAGPLAVQFDGSQSYDPQDDNITYLWDFGDGITSDEINPQHTFTPPDNNPIAYKVRLTIQDEAGASASNEILISVNNTPPVVKITSVEDGALYPLVGISYYDLKATVEDNEHDETDFEYAWQTTLHHNNHTHPEPFDNEIETTTQIIPAGCDGEIYFYSFELTVTDGAGLTGKDMVRIYPDCATNIVQLFSFTATGLTDAIQCNWQTTQEIDLDYFEIQRKNSQDEFIALGTRESENVHNIPTDYDFLDNDPLVGNNTYRLKMVGNNEVEVFSDEITVLYLPLNEVISYPNPVEDEMTFIINQPTNSTIDFYNMKGQLLKTETIEGIGIIEKVVNINNWDAGTYIYVVKHGDVSINGKIVKL